MAHAVPMQAPMQAPMPPSAMDAVVQLHAPVDLLASIDPASLPERELAEATLALRRQIDRQEAVFARLAHAAHVRGVGRADGAVSTAAWLRHHAGMRQGDARGAIEAGGAAELLPEMGEAWRNGDISTAAARTITGARVEGHDDAFTRCGPIFMRFAREGDMVGLRRACAHARNLAYAQGAPPRVPDGLTMSKGWDGTLVLNGELHGVAAETVATAINAYMDPPSADDPRSEAERRAAALERAAGAALSIAPAGLRHRAQVTMVVDYETLTEGRLGRTDGQFTGPAPIPDIERVLCDCSVSRVVTGPDSRPLDVGRSTRTVPPALRRALLGRDEGCRFPGCDRPPGWCEAHHVLPWYRGGATSLDNLVLMCGRHHRLVHEPGWSMAFDGERLTVTRPGGTVVRASVGMPAAGRNATPGGDDPPQHPGYQPEEPVGTPP